nr:PREDICTED: R3H domain-containing protein 4-like [Bemisia tabaci]
MGITRTGRDIDNQDESVSNYHSVNDPPEPSDLESEAVSVISEAVVDFDDEVVFIESDLNRLNDELTQLLVIEQPRRPAPRIRRRARSESLVYFLDKQVLNPKKMASLGKRAARRYANSMQLIAFAEKDLDADDVDSFLSRCREGPFYGLLSEKDSEELSKFISGLGLDEICPKKFLQSAEMKKEKPRKKSKNSTKDQFLAETAFRKISTYQRSLFKGRNSPRGIIETQENTLVNFFETSPAEIWESAELSDFERLIMHGVTEYYQLQSKSIPAKNKNKLMRVSNHKAKFSVPPLRLTEYLDCLDLQSNRSNCRTPKAA